MSWQSVIAADSPVAWYRLNETSGIVAADSSGNGLHGTYLPNSGGVWTGGTQGVAGATADGDLAAQFGGSGYVNIPANAAFVFGTGDFSAECLVKMNSGDTTNRIAIGRVAGGWLGSISGRATCSLGSNATGAFINDGAWHHLVMVRASAQLRVYVDSVASSPVSSTTNASSFQAITIGRLDTGFYWNNSIDEPAVYNYALTPTQVAAHYAAISDAGLMLPRRRRNNLLLNSL